MIKIGILGCGNMGGAILRGWAGNPDLAGQISLYAYDKTPISCACNADKITILNSEAELAREADWLLLAVKPQYMDSALRPMRPELNKGKMIISIAAGLGISRLKELAGDIPVVRVMPNTPAMVGQGIFGLCFDDPTVNAEQKELVQKLFASIGVTLSLPEKLFNAFTALSGGGPAYVYYFLEALVEAGVSLGITRQESAQIALALAKGSVALAEESGQSLTALREQVCSPGGTTIEAINHFDRNGMRGHIIDAITMACEKGKKLG